MNRLEKENSHPRDRHIVLDKEEHKYSINGDTGYISVTKLVHEQFEDFDPDLAIDRMMKSKKWKEGHKWWGWSREALKEEWNKIKLETSEDGKSLHTKIESYINNSELKYPYRFRDLPQKMEDLEWNYFLNFVKTFPDLIPYRTEWKIYHEEAKVAGSIDLLCRIGDTNLFILLDYKRCKLIMMDNLYKKFSNNPILKHLADNNFTHYALQQNIYRFILSEKYGINIIKMMLVKIHPNATNFELFEVPDLSKEIFDLFEQRKGKILFDGTL